MNRIKVANVIMLLVVLSGVLQAQQRVSPSAHQRKSRIVGVVLDANNWRVVNASVRIANAKFERELKSGEEGDFEVELPAGVYMITVEAPGFKRFELSPLRVKSGVSELINIHLEVGSTNPHVDPFLKPIDLPPAKPSERLSPPKL